MSPSLEATIRIRVDLTNPGQYFACCGLLELADCADKADSGLSKATARVTAIKDRGGVMMFIDYIVREILLTACSLQ